MRQVRRSWFAAAFSVALIAGCSGGGGSVPPPNSPEPPGPGLGGTLSQFESCEDLRAALVEDAARKIEVQAARLREDAFVAAREPGFVVDGPGENPAPVPGSPQPSVDEAPRRDFTDTNVQVEGVDEADTVETDGDHLYLLHGQELVVLSAWPPETTAIQARVTIEGSPQAMFVAGGRAAVISWVYDVDGSLGGDSACRYFGTPLPEPLVGIAVDRTILPCAATFTKATVIDLTVDPPQVVREVYAEGGFTGARRHGSRVRMLVQRGWGLPIEFPDPWSTIWSPAPPANQAELNERVAAWQSQATAVIAASSLEELLPAHLERQAGALVEIAPSCVDVAVPPPGISGDGETQILAFDMSDDASPVRDSVIVGSSSQVFANADTLLLAQPEWGWFEREEGTDRTAVHVFSLSATSLEMTYLASGFVPGIPLNQFSFDVQGGVIRAATTVTSRESLETGVGPLGSRVTTARVAGEDLAIIGSTDDLAPGETIFATRFLGDRAYMVTFRRVDPLFVIDLGNPAAPAVLGEVELPGFSEYIHPLDETHLLTLGRDADADGRTRGAALRIFDVSDPARPLLSHVHLLPGDGWSPAEQNHLVFTFDAAHGRLAIPYTRYDQTYRSSLVVMHVDAAAGFSSLGEVVHDDLVEGAPCDVVADEGCSFSPDMRRGVFIEDWVYSISGAGVAVNAVSDLVTPVATVMLPQELPPVAGVE